MGHLHALFTQGETTLTAAACVTHIKVAEVAEAPPHSAVFVHEDSMSPLTVLMLSGKLKVHV